MVTRVAVEPSLSSSAPSRSMCGAMRKASVVEMVDKLVELARGKLNIGEDKQGNAKYMPVSPATQLTAAEALLDRGYGRPAQAIELAGKDGGPIVHESESAYDIICRRIEAIRQRIIEDGHLIEP